MIESFSIDEKAYHFGSFSVRTAFLWCTADLAFCVGIKFYELSKRRGVEGKVILVLESIGYLPTYRPHATRRWVIWLIRSMKVDQLYRIKCDFRSR